MKKIIILGAALCCIAVGNLLPHVIEINSLEELHTLPPDEAAVIEFYSPDCPHCIAARSAYESLANQYGDQIHFYRVSYANTSLKNAFDEYDVQSFPAFKYVKNGKVIQSDVGSPNKQNIIALI